MQTLIHIGDLHLGPGPRNADRLRALDEVVDYGLAQLGLAAWLMPGDLNHGRMTIDDRNALADRLHRMADAAPVVLVYGNHDVPRDLEIFARLQTRWPVIVVSRPEMVIVSLPPRTDGDGDAGGGFEKAAVFALPYPTRAGLLASGTPATEIVSRGREALEAIVRQAAVDLTWRRDHGALPLMIGHVNVAGAIASCGQPQIGQEIELDAALLALLPPCYAGLNHIHKGQTIGGAWYPGSLCRMDWGEVEEKRALRIDIAPSGGYTVSPIPVTVAPMYHVEGALTRDGFTAQITAGPGGADLQAPPSWAGCEVRVRYRFPASQRDLVDPAEIRARFADAARLDLEPVAVPDRALRAPEVAEARALADKVRAWAHLNGLSVADSTLNKLAALEHGDAAHVLADVATSLAGLEAADLLRRAA